MSPKNFALFVLSVTVGLAVVVSGCSPAPSAPPKATSAPPEMTSAPPQEPEEPESATAIPEDPEPMTPEQVVESFYGWHIGYIQNVGNPLADGAYRSSEYLSEEFVRKADGIIASFDEGGYDPFLCAQDVPGEFTVEEAVVSGDGASLAVHTSFEGHTFTVELRQVDGRWKISDVICPGTETGETGEAGKEEPAASWQVFADEEHGFQVRFPENWTYEERPPVPPEMEVPEELKALKRLLLFEPQGWDGTAPPLTINVTEGTEEEFGQIYGPATSVENLEINGYAVVKAIEDLGEMRAIRYIFQSPSDENVRIVVIDSISGSPERAEGNEDVVEIVRQMLSTFEFTQ